MIYGEILCVTCSFNCSVADIDRGILPLILLNKRTSRGNVFALVACGVVCVLLASKVNSSLIEFPASSVTLIVIDEESPSGIVST